MHSSAPDNEPAPPHPSLVLAPYAERFFDGRRVAIFGEATSGLAQAVAARGARHVHVYDPDGARASRAHSTHGARGVAYAALTGDEPGIRDGAYDVTLIPDLSLFTQVRPVLARARQVTASAGVVLVVTPYLEGERGQSKQGGGPLNYYDLYDALSKYFPVVKMAGQVPFHGYAVVDFGAQGEPTVSVDTSLAEESAREPAYFLAVASERRLSVEPYAIVQLPGGEREAAASPAARREVEADRQALAEARAKIDVLRTEVDAVRDGRRAIDGRLQEEQRRSAELARALGEAESTPRQLERRLTEEARKGELVAAQLARANESLERLTRELKGQQERASQLARVATEAQADAARHASREEALQRRLREAEAAPRGVDSSVHQALKSQLETTLAEYEALQAVATTLAERAEHGEAEAAALQDAHAAEIAGAEAQLRERAREISVLRHEVDRRGAMVRELLEALEARETPSLGPSAALERERQVHLEQELAAARGRVETLSAQLARRETDVRAAVARISEPDRKIEQAAARAAAAPPAEVTPAPDAQPSSPKPADSAEPAEQPEATQPEETQHAAPAAPAAKADPAELEAVTAQLSAANVEIDALRRALLQERQARLQAETPSPDDAATFPAVLLDQLDAERG
jgi:predicted  nucleic acid-binding Zn-ribbon protein